MAKPCKGCNTCAGMCRETWEPLDGIDRIYAVLLIIAAILVGLLLWL